MIKAKKIKQLLKKIPLLGPFLKNFYKFLNNKFFSSSRYWDNRYKSGMTSGSGSYGRLAEFKADFLNNFIFENSVKYVVEFGCGDGAQLSLAKYPYYVGFDVSQSAIDICRNMYSSKADYHFLHTSQYHEMEGDFDLALSLDVIYHLVEDKVFDEYMRRLFLSSKRYVVIYSYNKNRTYSSPHEKGREFLSWIEKNMGDWKLTDVIKNKYPYNPNYPDQTSQANFYVFSNTKNLT